MTLYCGINTIRRYMIYKISIAQRTQNYTIVRFINFMQSDKILILKIL